MMTETEKQTAAYFDSNRGCPIFVGDVYEGDGELFPYHKVVKGEKGFMVEHVGTPESFALTSEGPHLIKKKYVGNLIEEPDLLERLLMEEDDETEELSRHPHVEEPECVQAVAGEGEVNEPEVAEAVEVTPDKADVVEEYFETEIAAEVSGSEQTVVVTGDSFEIPIPEGCTVEVTDKDGNVIEPNENGEIEIPVYPVEENASVTESDTSVTENEVSTTESEENEQNAPENEQNGAEGEQDAETSEEKASENEQTNVAAFPKHGVPEVIANSKEEKQALMRISQINQTIKNLETENDHLQERVEYHSNLASTIEYQPFLDLKNLICEALHENVDNQNIKKIKDRTKDYEAIDNIENLLKDHRDQANRAGWDIENNENEIEKLNDEKDEINQKLRNFQTKLF